jgi:hypothetical protein
MHGRAWLQSIARPGDHGTDAAFPDMLTQQVFYHWLGCRGAAMPEATKSEPPLSANQISWFVTVGAFLLILPYAVGFLYAVFALPLYAVACKGETSREAILGQAAKPIREEKYHAFLKDSRATTLSVRSMASCGAASKASTNAIVVYIGTSMMT